MRKISNERALKILSNVKKVRFVASQVYKKRPNLEKLMRTEDKENEEVYYNFKVEGTNISFLIDKLGMVYGEFDEESTYYKQGNFLAIREEGCVRLFEMMESNRADGPTERAQELVEETIKQYLLSIDLKRLYGENSIERYKNDLINVINKM